MISRRVVLKGIAAGTAASLFCGFRAPAAMDKHSFKARMLELEHRYGGRLGVGVLDTASNRTCTHRGHERFLMCSTFKLVAAGLILSRVDQRRESLDRRVRYHDSALVTYSPETEKHVDQGMTLAAICKAAVTLSDNTAGNLMLESFGGPDALTAYCRSLGDQVTRLDDREPLPDASESGSEANTTTPAAMLGLVQRMVLGDALSASSRRQIQSWMVANRTGDDRLRAGLPDRWRVGDKTGSGAGNTANDIAHAQLCLRSPYGHSPFRTQTLSQFERLEQRFDGSSGGIGHIVDINPERIESLRLLHPVRLVGYDSPDGCECLHRIAVVHFGARGVVNDPVPASERFHRGMFAMPQLRETALTACLGVTRAGDTHPALHG